jgi:hypothetical protein
MRNDEPNRLWTHAQVRRLDAEVIRDHLLSAGGTLDRRIFGTSTPLATAPQRDVRRGLYVETRRRGQNAFLATFDLPAPTTTRAARDVTTTPSQSITMLNSEFVWQQARRWAEHDLETNPEISPSERIEQLLVRSLTRRPTKRQCETLRAFYQQRSSDRPPVDAWTDLAHLVFNLKEFIYLR